MKLDRIVVSLVQRRRGMARRSSVFGASAWMVLLTLALFFLPAVNGLIGGAVGGYKAGGVRRALAAALLPAVIVGAGMFLLLTLVDVTGMLGLFVGVATTVLVAVSEVTLFIGAAIGGLVGRRADLPSGSARAW
jgi:hypothetical protein